MKSRYLASVAATVVLFSASHVSAQEAGSATAAQPAETDDGEIIVTAQRREQKLSDVPISITALTGDQLAATGVVSSTDLATVTPGLQFPVAGAFAQPTIRGIGTTVTSAGSDANVAIYIDGVYQPSQAGNIFNFNNIERIEVLKGPQGTLYGRNATGGALNITTSTPSLTDARAKLSASYGSFSEVRLNGYVSVPVSDTLAVSVAGLYTDDDGYTRDVGRQVDLSNYDERAFRGKIFFKPTDNFELTLAGDWAKKTDLTGYSLKPLGGNTAQNVTIDPDPFHVKLSFTPDFSTKSRGASATAKLGLGDFTLSSISSIRRVDAYFFTDLDRTEVAASRAEFNTRQKTFTQEFNLASGDIGDFSFVTGAFYYNDKADNFNLRVNGVLGVTGRVTAEALAGYAEGTLELGPLSIIGGIRYSSEERGYVATRPTGNPTSLDTSVRYSAWTPRAALRYEFSPSDNVYATYSRGFKSGTYNVSGFSTIPVEPENVDAFEVGFKHYRAGVTFNASTFYYKYSNIQIQAIQVATGLTALTNAAKAEIYGAEAELAVPLGSGFDLRGGVAYTHSEYTSFPGALITTPRTAAAVCGANPNRPCGNTQAAGDASGNMMVRSPKWTGNLTLDYEGVFGGGTFRSSVTGSYNSGYYWDVDNRVKQDPYFLLNGRLSWGPEQGNWRISLWGRNLTNTTYQLYAVDTTQADAVAYARPRSVGVAVDFDFQ